VLERKCLVCLSIQGWLCLPRDWRRQWVLILFVWIAMCRLCIYNQFHTPVKDVCAFSWSRDAHSILCFRRLKIILSKSPNSSFIYQTLLWIFYLLITYTYLIHITFKLLYIYIYIYICSTKLFRSKQVKCSKVGSKYV